jgi:hypothetical protein
MGAPIAVSQVQQGSSLMVRLLVLAVVLTLLVLVEAWLYGLGLGIRFGRLAGASAVANVASTLAGIPAAFLMAHLEQVLLRLANHWTLEVVSVVPLLVLSVLIELPIARRMLRLPVRAVRAGVWLANLVTYGLLVVWVMAAR